jgi:colanic acid biosynthesis glycosyl transferase WcaI
MRILLYSANFAPEPTGIGKYSGELAQWLAAHGHSVRVVAAPPYYPNWKISPDYVWPPFRRERWNGLEVWRAPLWVPKKPGGITRILHLMSFAIASFPLVLRQVAWRPDLVITVAPAFLCAPAGLIAARLCGAKSWLHLQDFEIDLAFRMGFLKGKTLQRVVLRMERWLLRRFANVSSISSRMVEQLLKKGVPVERTRYFPNWVDIAHIKPTLGTPSYRQQMGIDPAATVVLFSGSLPALAHLLAYRSDIVFVVCGDGVMKPKLEQATVSLPNVRFLPLQPFERLGELLCVADIHLLPQSPGAADLVLPSKLSGMLASGRPVISSSRAGTELEAVVSKCGMVVQPHDNTAFAAAICCLADNAVLRSELGRRARAYAESHFERDAILGRLFGMAEGDIANVVNDAVA